MSEFSKLAQEALKFRQERTNVGGKIDVSPQEFGLAMMQIYKQINREDFLLFQEHRWMFNRICMYFTGDKKFESLNPGIFNPYSLEKGLFLIGPVGSGKTTMLKLARTILNLRLQGFLHKVANEIEIDFTNRGFDTITELSKSKRLYIESVGLENKDAGNYSNSGFMIQLFDSRHRLWENFGYQTHFCSNLSMKMFQERYGEHCKSRIMQMCNVISYNNGGNHFDLRIDKQKIQT